MPRIWSTFGMFQMFEKLLYIKKRAKPFLHVLDENVCTIGKTFVLETKRE